MRTNSSNRGMRLVVAVALLAGGTLYGIASAQLRWFPAPQLISTWYELKRAGSENGLIADPTVALAAMSDDPVAPGTDIVILGDSLTLKGRWAERFTGVTVVNRGIGGDGISGIENRLDPIIQGKPSRIFLMAGINDLLAGNPSREILRGFERIAARMPAETELVVQSVLPCAPPRCGAEDNERIRRFNTRLEAWSRKDGHRYIDLYSSFAKDEVLDPALTSDGIHLNAAGYRVWQEAIALQVNRTSAAEFLPTRS